MTKKDYVKAAKIVVELKSMALGSYGETFALGSEEGFVKLFRDDNPNFDETKFREACKGGK